MADSRAAVRAAAADRAARRRRRLAIRREAQDRMAGIHSAPSCSALHSPRMIGGAVFLLIVLGVLLVRRVSHVVEDERPYPHYSALRSLNNLATALGRYRFHVGSYPSEAQGLLALMANPGEEGWNGPYIIQLKRDPWGTPYVYAVDADGNADVSTAGPDCVAGTPDDLRPDPDCYDPGTDWTNGWLKVEDRLPRLDGLAPWAADSANDE